MTAETRTWTGPSAPERLSILHGTESIAVVGASDKPSRASYFVSTYLLSSSPYRVYFVNPALREIMGRPVYPSLADLPETPDVVDAFRRHDDLPGVAREAVARGARRSGVKDIVATAEQLQALDGKCEGRGGLRLRRRDPHEG